MTTSSRARKRIYTRRDAVSSLAVACVVGTLLVLVNQGPGAYAAMWTQLSILVRVIANYLIPFTVASTGAALANRAQR